MNKKYPLYRCDSDDSHRYLMGEDIIKDDEIIICIGVNPSTANQNELDPTLTRLDNYCKIYREPKCKWVMFNLYPQRAANPNELDNDLDQEQHKENIRVFRNFLCKRKKTNITILAAWGSLIYKRKYLINCLNEIYQIANCFTWKCVKTTVKGNPKHWIGAPYPEELQEFDVEKYLSKFNI